MGTSRLALNEKNRLVKQSVLYFIGGLGILLLFFAVLLPLFTKILLLGAQKLRQPTATPSVNVSSPTLSAPYTATNSAQITLKGSATNGISVLLGLNGSIDRKTTADDQGNYTFENVTLSVGENLLFAYAEDSSGNRSDGSNAVTVTYSTDAPKLEISEPAEGALITQRKQSVISVKGTTDGGNKVYLNGQFLFVAGDGSFSGSVQLVNGDNTLTVKAMNTAGNETLKEIHVKYMP